MKKERKKNEQKIFFVLFFLCARVLLNFYFSAPICILWHDCWWGNQIRSKINIWWTTFFSIQSSLFFFRNKEICIKNNEKGEVISCVCVYVFLVVHLWWILLRRLEKKKKKITQLMKPFEWAVSCVKYSVCSMER